MKIVTTSHAYNFGDLHEGDVFTTLGYRNMYLMKVKECYDEHGDKKNYVCLKDGRFYGCCDYNSEVIKIDCELVIK